MDYSEITPYLYIVASPAKEDADLLIEKGVRLVLAMNHKVPPANLHEPPLSVLRLSTSDSPFLPMPMSKLHHGVNAALPVIRDGHAVAVYCNRGRHRSVAMACCILIAMGYSSDEAMALVKRQRAAADPTIFYIKSRIKKFEREWHAVHEED